MRAIGSTCSTIPVFLEDEHRQSKGGTPVFCPFWSFVRPSRVANIPRGPAPYAQTHLEPYGFTDEEVIRLLVGQPRQEQQQQEQQLHKSAPTPKQKPSLDVAKEGGEEQAGQMNKPGGEDEGGGKRDGSEGNEGELVSEPPGRGEGPKVEVEKGEKGRGRRR